MRLRILGRLRREGPATATTLAREFGLNSGATSYHLRQLAGHGLIEEDGGRGNRRERWWRAPHSSTLFDDEALSGESGESFLRAVGQIHFDQIQRTLDRHVTMTEQWRSELNVSDWMLSLTPEEAGRLNSELAEVMRRYRRHDPQSEEPRAPGAIPVAVQCQVLPQVNADDPEDD